MSKDTILNSRDKITDGIKGLWGYNESAASQSPSREDILESWHNWFSPNTFRWLAFDVSDIHPQPLDHLLADLVAPSHIDGAETLWTQNDIRRAFSRDVMSFGACMCCCSGGSG